MQTAVGKVDGLASAPTLSRLETRATRADVAQPGTCEQFIAAHKQTPAELVLDVDASVVPLHSEHELAQFHGYFDRYCYLPLYVFCGQAMHACVLRLSRIDAAKQAARPHPPAPGLAAGEDHRARRLGLLPSEAVAALQAPGLNTPIRPILEQFGARNAPLPTPRTRWAVSERLLNYPG